MELDQLHNSAAITSSSSFGRYFASTAAMAVAQPSLTVLLYAAIFIWVTMLRKFSIRFISLGRASVLSLLRKRMSSSSEHEGREGSCLCTKYDLQTVMQVMGMKTTDSREPDELIEFKEHEMEVLFEEKEPTNDEVEAAFSVFDKNGDGFIDACELHTVLSKLGFADGLELKSCQLMVEAYDQNGDGRIDFDEFVKFLEGCFSS